MPERVVMVPGMVVGMLAGAGEGANRVVGVAEETSLAGLPEGLCS
jgi:hypothetical protein